MNIRETLHNPLDSYRETLIAAEQRAQADFDKTVLLLSGGALGVSFTFLKEVIGPRDILSPDFLLGAWCAWAFSTFAVLMSFFASHMALRRAISQVDDGTIYKAKPGGTMAVVTATLNVFGVVLFVVGVICITVFASANLRKEGTPNGRQGVWCAATGDKQGTGATCPSAQAGKANAPTTAPSGPATAHAHRR